ncbi:hypothetical protein OPV22_013681 [Ensete ventricosum]|uniref:DUF7950 domain-containing protein n=1 Tax=Ensete ventricosum TaxID=4639 RepID=A0AAV8R5Z9_ENSVE|nr:hypothetical protein OPV22_013681 [Ensete ventricosum]
MLSLHVASGETCPSPSSLFNAPSFLVRHGELLLQADTITVTITAKKKEEMVRGGGCCITMYGRVGDVDAAWKVRRIMLRFRPIAPKPASAETGSPAVSVVSTEARAVARRPKRKRSAKSQGWKLRKGHATAAKEDEKSPSTIVTLPLIPETPEGKDEATESSMQHSSPVTPAAAVVPTWMGRGVGEGAESWSVRRVVSLWVMVECVTDMWREGEIASRSDEGVKAALAADECPGFVSDVWERVTWTNDACRRMVVGSSLGDRGVREEDQEVRVELVTRELVPSAWECRAFTCRVRVRQAKPPGRQTTPSSPLAAPCDVWRLDSGGCAWRLDVKAALSLGF